MSNRLAWPMLLALMLATGCGTSALDTARHRFYEGDFAGSAQALEEGSDSAGDQVLVLMERGTARQASRRYADSIEDWLEARTLADKLDYISVSKQSVSMVVNDSVLTYRGAPYERVLLHAFAAQSFMALSLWDEAGVEARNIIQRLEERGDYPDDAFSRYVAALSLDLGNDPMGAAFQYAQAARATTLCRINPDNGQLSPPVPTSDDEEDHAGNGMASALPLERPGGELICLVGIGRGPSAGRETSANWRWGGAPYAEFYAGGRLLGRSYTLATTSQLHQATRDVEKLRRGAKTAARVALKETAAQLVSNSNEDLGDLLRLLLFALETEDTRQWETLPQWMGAARVPCPPNLREVDVVFRSGNGTEIERRTLINPLNRQGKRLVGFVRAL